MLGNQLEMGRSVMTTQIWEQWSNHRLSKYVTLLWFLILYTGLITVRSINQVYFSSYCSRNWYVCWGNTDVFVAGTALDVCWENRDFKRGIWSSISCTVNDLWENLRHIMARQYYEHFWNVTLWWCFIVWHLKKNIYIYIPYITKEILKKSLLSSKSILSFMSVMNMIKLHSGWNL